VGEGPTGAARPCAAVAVACWAERRSALAAAPAVLLHTAADLKGSEISHRQPKARRLVTRYTGGLGTTSGRKAQSASNGDISRNSDTWP